MDYRREIDGLRALAVIPVILFHAGLQGFSGGYVGVDVFFVISGYLITSIILAEKQAGTFKLANFYERRARRILPALFVMMFACLPFSWLWLFPTDFKQFSESLISVSTFASNIFFWKNTTYFDTPSELEPLLHTWSLAVEEQYYLLFPILMLTTWRLGRFWIVAILVVLALVSLAMAQWGPQKQAFTFFLLPTRGWEILFGAIVAFFLFTRESAAIKTENVGESLSVVGLLLIAYAVFAFDKQIPFPSLYTLIPTIGAALIILFATEQTLVGKLLGSKLFVGIGLISYSAYLWHQPLFAFARHKSIETPSKLLLSALAATSLVLAYLSWKYVETPFRKKQYFKRKQIIMYGALCSTLFIVFGFVGHFNGGFETRFSNEERAVLSFEKYDIENVYRLGFCFLEEKQTYLDFNDACRVSNNLQSTLIWGDSHAAALSPGLRKEISNVIQYTASGCPPIKDAVFIEKPNCKEVNDFVMREIQHLKPSQIFLHADWTSYKEQASVKNIKETIDYIRGVSPSTRVTIVGSVPHWLQSLPVFMAKNRIVLDSQQYLPNYSIGDLSSLDELLDDVAKENHARFFSAINALCVNDKCQATTAINGTLMPTAWDYGHLTEGGSALLAKELIDK